MPWREQRVVSAGVDNINENNHVPVEPIVAKYMVPIAGYTGHQENKPQKAKYSESIKNVTPYYDGQPGKIYIFNAANNAPRNE